MGPGSYLSSGLAKTLEKKLRTQRIKDYLKSPTTEKIFVLLLKLRRLTDIIKPLKSSKSVGPFSIPTKVPKIAKQERNL